MSEDLINRNELVERVNYLFVHTNENTPEHYAYGVVLKEIRELPTAYDKDKMLEELRREISLTVQIREDKQHNKVSQRAFEKFKGLLEEGQ